MPALKVFIEAGHGAGDPGAVVDNVKEADIITAVAHAIEKLGYTIKRRTSQGLLWLLKTIGMMPDAWVSLHCDSSAQDPGRHECKVYYLETREESKRLALCLVDALRNAHVAENVLLKTAPYNRAGKLYAYPPLKYGKRASVLIEMGFLSDVHFRMEAIKPEWQSRVASGIDNGIKAWISTIS